MAAAPFPNLVRIRALDDDENLVGALRLDDPTAAAALYDRYAKHVERVLARVLGPDAELPELIQEVFLRALDRIGDLRRPELLRAWLASIAVFTARGCIRRRRRHRWLRFMAPADVPEVAAHPIGAEVSEAVRATYAVFERMPVDERTAFALRFVNEMDLGEVAAACGISLATVKRRLAKAEARFRKMALEDPVLRELAAERPAKGGA